MGSPYDPTLYSRHKKTYNHTQNCTRMFRTALFHNNQKNGDNHNVLQWKNN